MSQQELHSHSLGNGSFGWCPKCPLHIRRARTVFAFVSMVTAAFALVWIIGVSEGDGLALSLPGTVFTIGFVFPVCAYSTFLAWIRTPVVSLYDDRIKLASPIFPWRTAVIDRETVLSVRFDGVRGDGPDTGPRYAQANLILNVSPDCFARHHRNRIWCNAVDSMLYFPTDNLELSQGQCFAMVEAYVLSGHLRQAEPSDESDQNMLGE